MMCVEQMSVGQMFFDQKMWSQTKFSASPPPNHERSKAIEGIESNITYSKELSLKGWFSTVDLLVKIACCVKDKKILSA
jgi:hypothetical protein